MSLPVIDPQAPPNLIKWIVTPIALTKAGTWLLKHVSRRIDPWFLKASRGRVSTVAFMPVVLLTCKGARSGLERTVALLYFTDGNRAVLMASNYGGTRHPAWYHNVRANPEVRLTARGSSGRFIGRRRPVRSATDFGDSLSNLLADTPNTRARHKAGGSQWSRSSR
jgi:deazaflavin-dependent oxidoreductase (nitroreductase family)